jgi:hypothetical protein
LLSRGVLGLRLVGVRTEVELVGGVRVVAGAGVGVRCVVRDDLLADPACNESFRVSSASIAETKREVLVEWASTHDGSVADLDAVTHGDVEFELEADPDSKSACWL